MNFGFQGGAFGEPAPEMNRTLADFFTAIIQVFSVLRYALQALF